MPELWVTVLMGVAAVLFAGAAGMAGLGVSNVVTPFLVEVKEESAGGSPVPARSSCASWAS
jgi:hypothetical protein